MTLKDRLLDNAREKIEVLSTRVQELEIENKSLKEFVSKKDRLIASHLETIKALKAEIIELQKGLGGKVKENVKKIVTTVLGD